MPADPGRSWAHLGLYDRTQRIDSATEDETAGMDWFENVKNTLETAYLSHTEPWRQSGMSGPEERWISLRKPVADCIDRSGTFLDIGCANGYLLECILRWTAERGLQVDPFGRDI